MPKKFQGENTKAAEARARKNVAKEEELERKKQAEEDAYWNDGDKNIARKIQRKEEKLKKQHEALERKQQAKALLEKENENLSTLSKNRGPVQKVTQADILHRDDQQLLEKQQLEEKRALAAKKITIADDLIAENVNRLVIEGEEARTVDEALKILDSTSETVDRNPEKRMKASYLAFEEKLLPLFKIENPNLRLSQLKQMIKKEWQKSPENPMNLLA